jgi:hypothetical protein
MKYKVGDKVSYDGGDWQYYGTVSAVIENPITPCYRVNVERIEKKYCEFSITQFEFELQMDKEKGKINLGTFDNEYIKRISSIQDSNIVSKPEEQKPEVQKPEVQKPVIVEAPPASISAPPKRKKRETWDNHLVSFQQGVKNKILYAWIAENRRQYKINKLADDKLEKLMAINFPFEVAKRGEAWYKNLESYQQGVKSNSVYTWVAENRKYYKTGKLSDEKLEKLLEINFPFEAAPKKKKEKPNAHTDIWDKQLNQWINGDNRPSLQQWRQQNVKRYVDGKLSNDRIEKLKQAGIIK